MNFVGLAGNDSISGFHQPQNHWLVVWPG